VSDVEQLRGGARVRALAVHLNRPDRTKPVVVISVPTAASAPYIDPRVVADELGELAEVYLIRTGEDTFTFSDHMPDLTQVYGGAGRVYPVGTEWVTDPHRSPLRFAFDAAQGERAARALVSDALRMASEAGLVSRTTPRSLPRRAGEVRGLPTPDRAVVRLDGNFATILQELTLPEVPLDRLLAKGMQVSGLYDEHNGRLDIRSELQPAAEALRHYEAGDVVLAQVETVEAETARLLLHPEVAVTVRREDVSSNELDELTSLMTPGEVLTARVVAASPRWRLSLIDVEDDEVPRTAASLLDGGPPWLQPRHTVVLDLETADGVDGRAQLPLPPRPAAPPPPTPAVLDRKRREVASPASGTPNEPTPALRDVSLALDAARARLTAVEQERDRLFAQVRALQDERAMAASHVDHLTRQRDHFERQLEQSRTARRRAARRQSRQGDTGDGGQWFLDPEEQFRFEVQNAWARRIPAAEKAARPLAEYQVGPEFLASVEAITGVSRDKIVDVVVELATGLAFELSGREVHQLRTDESGGAPQMVRPDGATAWRVALQRDAPQARRLHYWQRPGGTIELSRVAVHDDYTP
jgi:hypothetical protein